MVHERRDLHSAYLHVVALVEEWTSELQTLMAQADADLRRYISGNYMGSPPAITGTSPPAAMLRRPRPLPSYVALRSALPLGSVRATLAGPRSASILDGQAGLYPRAHPSLRNCPTCAAHRVPPSRATKSR